MAAIIDRGKDHVNRDEFIILELAWDIPNKASSLRGGTELYIGTDQSEQAILDLVDEVLKELKEDIEEHLKHFFKERSVTN